MSKKLKQAEIPGTEAPKIEAVEDAAEKYLDVRDKRMALTKKEVESRTILLHEMEKHSLKEYRFDDQIVTVSEKKGVKVRTISEDGEEEVLDD